MFDLLCSHRYYELIRNIRGWGKGGREIEGEGEEKETA